DRNIHYWVLAWWPAQPDLLSLLFGLPFLGCVALHIQTGQRRWAYLAPILFFLSVCSKEMGYFAGIGGCLLLLRTPRRWPLLGLIALEGLALFGFRRWVTAEGFMFDGGDFGLHRLRPNLINLLELALTHLTFLPVHLGLLAAGV